MVLTSADLARLGPKAQKQVLDKLLGEQKPKKSKYGNRKAYRVMPNGRKQKFDSEGEAMRYDQLKALLAAGRIRNLRMQVGFTLIEGFTDSDGSVVKPTVYKADFVYERPTEPDYVGAVRWLREVEDFKGMRTKDYLLKKKLMQERHGITIREVGYGDL